MPYLSNASLVSTRNAIRAQRISRKREDVETFDDE